ncbi:C-type lectin domain family 2 member B isoform X3 [Lemur catta]|uniref:C-type lectin domain family 2 member B isoform X3 n=1 Tax=Lemur catta TaxID=9447 RepID=UPI001E26BA56|nr:C-type lectin domain family 2 member B isoform X3 [Lemur catta]
MKTLAEALMKTENSNQGTDKNNQGCCLLFMIIWRLITGLMCRCKKYIAYILLVMIIIGPIVSIIVLLVQRHQSFCPDDWIGFQDKCYYFSEKEGDWKSSKDNCTTAHADLTTIDTDKEMV